MVRIYLSAAFHDADYLTGQLLCAEVNTIDSRKGIQIGSMHGSLLKFTLS